MMNKKNLKKLLNLNYVDIANQNFVCGKYDLPYIECPGDIDIDYLALYDEINNYFKTDNTCVCFYQYDLKFDSINGLFNAIYYDDKKALKNYKKRFQGVKYAISPDYSQLGDINRIENIYRLFKARIVSVWLTLECDILVIPNITYANENYFDVMLDGMEDTEIVAFSVKGLLRDSKELQLLKKAIKFSIDSLCKLKKIVVYSVSIDEKYVFSLFEYAFSKGIEIIIPDNTLKKRNVLKSEVKKRGT